MKYKTRSMMMRLFVPALMLALSACSGRADVKPLMAGIVDLTDRNETATSEESTDIALTAVTSNEALLTASVPETMAEQMLVRKAYIVSYNSSTCLPNYVAWQLTREHASGDVKRTDDYREDNDVTGRQATLADYKNKGYDRGHMCPAGDNKWDEEAMHESFLLTNMCPQVHGLNEGDWRELEERCRKWAKKYGEIYIVCGPLLYDRQHTTIGRNKVVVPEAFFKVVLRFTADKSGTGCRAIGFVYEHNGSNRPLSDYACSVDEVERLTGIDFFASLPDDIETTAEAGYDLGDW